MDNLTSQCLNKGKQDDKLKDEENQRSKDLETSKLQSLRSFVEQRQELKLPDHVLEQLKPRENWTASTIQEVRQTMECHDCHKVPSILFRQICPRGHLYCERCGNQRKKKDAGVCGYVMTNGAEQVRRFGYNTMPPQMTLSSWEEIELYKDKKTGRDPTYCCLQLNAYPPEPLSRALFNTCAWWCPCCENTVSGDKYFHHIFECLAAHKLLEF